MARPIQSRCSSNRRERPVILMTTLVQTQVDEQRNALTERLFGSALGTLDVLSIYLGDRLGLYGPLSDLAGCTYQELAARTGTHERYAQEWLEQQAASGLISVDDASAPAAERRFFLPPGHADVLLDRTSLTSMLGIVRLVTGVTRPLPAVLDAFRTGGGVPYADYGIDTVEGIAEINRPMFTYFLGSQWLPGLPDIHARLQAEPAARVLDIGCGVGWSTIAIARAYPRAIVTGLDSDDVSIQQAQSNAACAGLADRVTFLHRDAACPVLAARFDLVTAFETIHDMAQPVAALRAARELLVPGASMIIADERVNDVFQAPGTDVERLNYGFSILHCLPVGLAESPSAGTGTIMRPDTLRGYAREAGFDRVEVLPIENDFWQFYRLT